MAIGIKLKHNTGEITTGTGDLQLGAAGNLKLKYATFPSADGSNTHVLSTDGAGNLSWVSQTGGSTTLSGLTDVTITAAANNDVLQYNGTSWVDVALTTASIAEAGNLYYTDARVDTRFDTRLATKDTGDLSEGSNLYYTDARADARVSAGTGTIATQDANNVNIDGGAIDGTVIGSSGAAAITGTTITANSGFVGNLTGGVSGNADTATEATNITAVANNSTNETVYPVFVDGATGTQGLETDTGFTYNPSSGILTATAYAGDGSNLTGVVSTLAALTDTTISGTSSGQLLQWNGSAWVNATVSAASAAGSDTHVQFNDGGNIGADAGLTYAKATDTLTAGTFATSGASPTVTAAGAMAITTTASNGDITMTPHGSGAVIISNTDINGGAIDGTAIGANSASTGAFTTINASGAITGNLTGAVTGNASTATALQNARTISGVSFDGTTNITLNTSAITENTNLYYTDARADARVSAGTGTIAIQDANSVNIDGGTIDGTNIGVSQAATGKFVDLTVGSGAYIKGGVHVQNNTFTTLSIDSGGDIRFYEDSTNGSKYVGFTRPHSLGSDILWELPDTGGTAGQVLSTDGGVAPGKLSWVTMSGGIALTDLSVTTAAASGVGTLTYNNGSGVFTFAPADFTSVNIDGGNIDGTAIGVSTQSSGEFTTLNASGLSTLDNTDIQGNLGVYGDITLTGNLQKSGTDLTISTISNNNDILITPHGSGNVVIDNNTWPNADGSNGQQLYTNGLGALYWATGMHLGSFSVTTGSASGGGTLSYNNSNGVFTFQPADLSSYLTSTGVLSSHTDVHNAAPNTSDVLTWVASQSRWEPAAPQFTGFFGLSDTAVDTAADSIAFLDSDNSTKRDTIADFLTAIAGTNLTAAGGQLNASGGGGSQDVFKTIAVSGQSDVVADATTDTLTLAAGSNMTITTNAGSDTITFASTGGGGGGGTTYEEFKCNYHTDGSLLAASDLSSGISGVTIDSAAGGDVTVTFTGYTTPPVGIMFYGYGYASNIYVMNTIGSTGTTLRQLPGGGSSGSPTAFGSFSELKIKIREAETGASRSFGTVTHAWIRFVMGA